MKMLKPILIAIALFALAACVQKQTPEEVTHGFWQAVIDNDLDAARKLTTRDSRKNLNLLDNREKRLKAVEVGTATITAEKATVPTTLIGDAEGRRTRVELTTYLRKEDEKWRVEGERTVNALLASSLESLLQNLTGDLTQIGDAFNQAVTSGLQEFLGQLQKDVPAIKQELGRLTDEEKARTLGQELGTLFSQGLRDAMREFSKGLDDLEKELEKASPSQHE